MNFILNKYTLSYLEIKKSLKKDISCKSPIQQPKEMKIKTKKKMMSTRFNIDKKIHFKMKKFRITILKDFNNNSNNKSNIMKNKKINNNKKKNKKIKMESRNNLNKEVEKNTMKQRVYTE